MLFVLAILNRNLLFLQFKPSLKIYFYPDTCPYLWDFTLSQKRFTVGLKSADSWNKDNQLSCKAKMFLLRVSYSHILIGAPIPTNQDECNVHIYCQYSSTYLLCGYFRFLNSSNMKFYMHVCTRVCSNAPITIQPLWWWPKWHAVLR